MINISSAEGWNDVITSYLQVDSLLFCFSGVWEQSVYGVVPPQ